MPKRGTAAALPEWNNRDVTERQMVTCASINGLTARKAKGPGKDAVAIARKWLGAEICGPLRSVASETD